MEKKFVVKAIIVLVLLVFIANILMAFIILPASYYQDFPPGAPPLPRPTFLEILFISITNPLVLILALGGGLLLILSAVGKKETAIPDRTPDRYRIYLTFILTLFAFLSIQLWNPAQYPNPNYEYNSIIPLIIMVSVVTIFIAVTTYMRRYYPYAAIFASILLGAFYLPALSYITYTPVFVASAWWRDEKMGVVYPVTYSLVWGFVVGVLIPKGPGWEGLGLLFIYLLLTVLSGILTVILFLTKSRYELANKYFITSLKVTLSLIVFLIMMVVTSNIFQPYYNPRGLSD